VSPDNIQVKTVRVEGSANFDPVDLAAPFETPKGLKLWEAGGEEILTIAADRYGNVKKPPNRKLVLGTLGEWDFTENPE
jgi:hypothetical protein